MPLTLPTHPMAVLPLKLWRPRWFDGVALTVGTTAPDIPYALYGTPLYVKAHTLPALLWWSLPVTLLLTRLVRRAAPVVAAHLPPCGPLRVRDYGVLGGVRHPWWITAGSAVLGAFSHLAWDWFTHPGYLPVLRTEIWAGTAWWELLSDGSNLAGAAAAAAFVLHVGQSGLLRERYGAPPGVPVRPVAFWVVVGVVSAVGVVVAVSLPTDWHAARAVRVVGFGAVAVLCAAEVAGWRRGDRVGAGVSVGEGRP